MHILFLLQTAFSIWMLTDAVRRGAQCYWFYIILMPFGELVYFFAVKIHDPQFRSFKTKLLSKPASLKELRYQAESSPCIHNKTLLAQALYDNKDFVEASRLFEEISKTDKDNKAALHGLGLCLLHLKEAVQAIQTLEHLVSLDLTYDNFAPCADLAQLYWEQGQKKSAIELLEKISRKTQRLSHKTELARYLSQSEEKEKAKQLLEEALMDYENSPKYPKAKRTPLGQTS